MLSLYLVGNLIGRLLMAYLVVWLVCLALARGNARAAFARSRRWPAVVALVVLFGLGLVGSVGRAVGPSFGQ